MKRIGVLVGVATLLLMTSCDFFSKKTKEVVVAECYGKYLYASDLLDIVPENTATLDSLMRVNAFIDSWIQRQVLLHQAETNLDKKELDLDKQLEEYRNSLVVYAYETKLIDQKLDTVVSEDEITEFYEQNKEDFQVRNTMVRAAYVILKDDCKQKPAFEKLMSDKDTLMLQNLDVLATYYAEKSFLDVDHWIRLDELTNIVPIEILNVESFLKKNKYVHFDSDDYTYMVRFEDYLLEESISPLEMQYDNIKNVILTHRKQALLERMRKAVYEKAVKEHAFAKYVGTPTIDNKDQ